jgi:hypothetical protein
MKTKPKVKAGAVSIPTDGWSTGWDWDGVVKKP